MKYPGSCHCGKLRFEVELTDTVTAHECNCSLCVMLGFQHLIVPARDFTLLSGQPDITTYTFGSGVAKHTFCQHCGVKPFYTPRSNPEGISVNLRCLQDRPPTVAIEPFDGQNWERNAHTLSHLSE